MVRCITRKVAERRHATASGFNPRNEPTEEGKPRSGDMWNRDSCHRSAHTTTIHACKGMAIRSPHMAHLSPLRGFGNRCNRRPRTEVRGYRLPSLRDSFLGLVPGRGPTRGRTKPGGRGWTEPAKETPVRLTTRIRIRVDRPNDPPGFHSCLAPTPATRCVSRATAMFRTCGPSSPKHARRCFSGNPQTTYSVDPRLRSTSALGPWGSEAPSTAGRTS